MFGDTSISVPNKEEIAAAGGAPVSAEPDESWRNSDTYKMSVDLLEKEQAFNAQQAELNRQFQLESRRTYYQDAVADLMKAGLNPVLAANGFSSAGLSGSSAQASGSPAGSIMSAGISSAASQKNASTSAGASIFSAIVGAIAGVAVGYFTKNPALGAVAGTSAAQMVSNVASRTTTTVYK